MKTKMIALVMIIVCFMFIGLIGYRLFIEGGGAGLKAQDKPARTIEGLVNQLFALGEMEEDNHIVAAYKDAHLYFFVSPDPAKDFWINDYNFKTNVWKCLYMEKGEWIKDLVDCSKYFWRNGKIRMKQDYDKTVPSSEAEILYLLTFIFENRTSLASARLQAGYFLGIFPGDSL